MFHEIATQTPYQPSPPAQEKHLGAVITALPDVLEVPECEEQVKGKKLYITSRFCEWMSKGPDVYQRSRDACCM
jgi:hypothetical protein